MSIKKENYPKAIPGEARWVDFDEETQLWCVFGLLSGHAYSSHATESDARGLDKKQKAGKMVSR